MRPLAGLIVSPDGKPDAENESVCAGRSGSPAMGSRINGTRAGSMAVPRIVAVAFSVEELEVDAVRGGVRLPRYEWLVADAVDAVVRHEAVRLGITGTFDADVFAGVVERAGPGAVDGHGRA